jgi:hypothetical protein
MKGNAKRPLDASNVRVSTNKVRMTRITEDKAAEEATEEVKGRVKGRVWGTIFYPARYRATPTRP